MAANKLKNAKTGIIPIERIENRILLIRGEKVMLDRDLAELYGVETKVLNQAVKRNIERFPDDFMFQLTRLEAEFFEREGLLSEILKSQFVVSSGKNGENNKRSRSQIVTLNDESSENSQRMQLQKDEKKGRGYNVKYLPFVFTEQGVAMLSSVLKSQKAIEVNIAIMRAFVKLRHLVYSYKDLADKIIRMEKKYDRQIVRIFEIIDRLMEDEKADKKEIGFKVE